MARRLVIYYGWLAAGPHGAPTEAARRIAATRPELVIAAAWTRQPIFDNLSRPVVALFGEAGTEVAAYVSTGYGHRAVRAVVNDVQRAAAVGANAVLFDEVADLRSKNDFRYFSQISGATRELGLTVIMNTGVAHTDACVMDLADILMVEHQWRPFALECRWRAAFPPERFMGASTNEIGAAALLGYAIDAETAVRDTLEARELGIGWHYSADAYTELPDWFEDYMTALGAETETAQ